MKTVEFWMKDKPKEYAKFKTIGEARAFMQALACNDNCECYGLLK